MMCVQFELFDSRLMMMKITSNLSEWAKLHAYAVRLLFGLRLFS